MTKNEKEQLKSIAKQLEELKVSNKNAWKSIKEILDADSMLYDVIIRSANSTSTQEVKNATKI